MPKMKGPESHETLLKKVGIYGARDFEIKT